MYKYFKSCKTAEEGKRLYRELAKKYHSDNGGNDNIMKEINAEYTDWFSTHKDIHTNTETGETYTSTKKTKETAQDFIDIITALVNLADITIEICGSWLWLTGNTYQVKDELKKLGCRFATSKKQWYWTKDEYYHTRYTLSAKKRRAKYGSEIVNNSEYKNLKLEA